MSNQTSHSELKSASENLSEQVKSLQDQIVELSQENESLQSRLNTSNSLLVKQYNNIEFLREQLVRARSTIAKFNRENDDGKRQKAISAKA